MTVVTGSRSSAAGSLRGVPVPHGSPAAVPGGRPPGGAAVTRIRLLGRFAVERDGQEIALASFGGRLARQLLRLLALRRGTLVVKELIADALWPDNPPADPAGNIEVLVSRIRRAMGDRTLVRTGPGGYVLADSDRCWVDAEAFLSAVQAGQAALAARPADRLASFRAALGIWHGEPLPEDTYADWAQAGRRRLWLAYLDALDGAATAALDSPGAVAAAGEAAAWARQAVAAEPLRESSVLLLVRALAAAGDQAGALVAFDRYRDRLAAETGLDPTLRALERTVPFQIACQAVAVTWYATAGHDPADLHERRASAPWYTSKAEPATADMAAKLRRVLIAARFKASRPERGCRINRDLYMSRGDADPISDRYLIAC